MELNRELPAGGRQLIDSYGEGGFKLAGRRHRGSILILADAAHRWPVEDIAALSLENLGPVIDAEPKVELLIIGSGAALVLPPAGLREALRAKDIALETMDTGAACRTYNLLAGEGRRVAAALIAL